MEKYAYLILGLSLVLLLAVLLSRRKELAPQAIKLGMLGGVTCLILDPAFFRDYWRPPSLSVFGSNYVENFIFGFAVTAVSFVLYPVVFKLTPGKREYPERKNIYLTFFIISMAALILCTKYVGLNSMYVSSGIFLFFGLLILLMRHDLIAPAMYSALLMTVFIVILYGVTLNFLVPNYINKYFLLTDTKWGVTIVGKIPVIELLWFSSWALFAGISQPFVSGRKLAERREPSFPR